MEKHKLLPFMKSGIYECGVDEVGRGSLAGIVVAAAVILPNDFDFELIKDSKKLNEKQRHEAVKIIKEHAIAWGLGSRSAKEIDDGNILKCTFDSMHSAINKMEKDYNLNVNHLLIDGNIFRPYFNVEYTCVIKGDNTYYSIAAASILAKVTRDEYMKKLAKEFPGYGWETNAGYGTKVHRDKIVADGVTEHHRMSFLGNILPRDVNNLF